MLNIGVFIVCKGWEIKMVVCIDKVLVYVRFLLVKVVLFVCGVLMIFVICVLLVIGVGGMIIVFGMVICDVWCKRGGVVVSNLLMVVRK